MLWHLLGHCISMVWHTKRCHSECAQRRWANKIKTKKTAYRTLFCPDTVLCMVLYFHKRTAKQKDKGTYTYYITRRLHICKNDHNKIHVFSYTVAKKILVVRWQLWFNSSLFFGIVIYCFILSYCYLFIWNIQQNMTFGTKICAVGLYRTKGLLKKLQLLDISLLRLIDLTEMMHFMYVYTHVYMLYIYLLLYVN